MSAAAPPPGSPDLRPPGRLARLLRRRGRASGEPLVDDGSLAVVARAFDVERGDAAVLDELAATGHDLAQPVLLRHVFRVHDGADVQALRGGLAADGYAVALSDATLGEATLGEAAGDDASRDDASRDDASRDDASRGESACVTATATVLPTPLSTAQARARMTGLTTRHPVDYLGWELLVRRP